MERGPKRQKAELFTPWGPSGAPRRARGARLFFLGDGWRFWAGDSGLVTKEFSQLAGSTSPRQKNSTRVLDYLAATMLNTVDFVSPIIAAIALVLVPPWWSSRTFARSTMTRRRAV